MSYRVSGSRILGSRALTRLLAPAIFAIVAAPLEDLGGQATGVIVGTVTAEKGIALVGVDVTVRGTQLRTTTDDRGEFRLPGVPSGTVELTARRLGFRPASVRVTVERAETETITLSLAISAQDLLPVLVRGQQVKYTGRLAGYYQRLERGTGGVFVTRDQIDRERPRNLTQLLQRVPGISLQRRGGAAMGVRMRDRTCWPLVWLDGNALSSGEADIDGILPSSLEGIELYMGSTTAPAQFSWTRNMSSCGTILLWSRASDNIPRKWADESSGLDSLVASLAVFTADAVDRTAVLDSGVPLVIPYPPSLYASHVRGTVIAEFVVDTVGRVEPGTFAIVASSHPLFTEAVRQGVKVANFKPAIRAGKPVRQVVHQPFEFTAFK